MVPEKPSSPIEQELPAPEFATLQIVLSPETHARALLICQRRQSTLEAIVGDLLDRFLPPVPSADAAENDVVDRGMTHGVPELPWRRQRRQRPKI